MVTKESVCIPYKTDKNVRLKIGDPNADFNSGCSIMEVSFPANISCKIGYITFKNNYVASLSVRLKCRQADGSYIWITVLKNSSLMPSPHHEFASQDDFIIDAKKQFTEQRENVSAVRLILRQPSPQWSNFGLDNLAFYLPHENRTKDLSHVQSLEEKQKAAPDEQIQEINVSQISEKFNTAVSLASDERVANSLKKPGSTRFEVDGSYDLNLLSYT